MGRSRVARAVGRVGARALQRRRVCAALLTTLFLVLAGCKVPSPNAPGPPSSELAAVACPSATSCFAVGSQVTTTGALPLVEQFDGATWKVLPSPAPPSKHSSLDAVACASSTRCLAVGTWRSGASHVFSESWNGSAWTMTTVPEPTGTVSTVFEGLACTSATSCVAVGLSQLSGSDLQVTLAERWNGSSWSIMASPTPSGVAGARLAAVACPTTTSCLAVGTQDPSQGGARTLAERWNGTTWSIVTTPNPSGDGSLAGVECTSASSCLAVGESNGMTLVERWNGTSWSLVTTPNPSDTASLAGVACASATSCFAVGAYRDLSGSHVLVERWNGTTWAVSPSPTPADFASLAGVSCPTPTACVAVGSHSPYTSATLVERWNGASWSIGASTDPVGPTNSALAAVACANNTFCVAVGGATSGPFGSESTLIETSNGATWSLTPGPADPAGATSSSLAGVACPSTTSCFAVGWYWSSGANHALIERFDGTAWSVAASPTLSSDGSSLAGIACPSADSCFAVGKQGAALSDTPVAERWDGNTWSIGSSPPGPAGTSLSALAGVACPAPSSCVAAGTAATLAPHLIFESAFVDTWNGTSWSNDDRATVTNASLASLSCTTSTACIAVGTTTTTNGNVGTTKSFVEQLDDSGWSLVSSPTPGGATAAPLYGVACTTATSCYAVGSSSDSGGSSQSLIVRWDGTSWSIVTENNPTNSRLAGVSCATISCDAAGTFVTQGDFKKWDNTLIDLLASP